MHNEPPGTYYDDLDCIPCGNSGAYEHGENIICRECWLEREMLQLRKTIEKISDDYLALDRELLKVYSGIT